LTGVVDREKDRISMLTAMCAENIWVRAFSQIFASDAPTSFKKNI
jgi:hypothetical protein